MKTLIMSNNLYEDETGVNAYEYKNGKNLSNLCLTNHIAKRCTDHDIKEYYVSVNSI